MGIACLLALVFECWPQESVRTAEVRLPHSPEWVEKAWRDELPALDSLRPEAREQSLLEALEAGAISSDLSRFQAIDIHSGGQHLRYWVSPDYLAVGEGEQRVRVAMGWGSTKKLLAKLGMLVPTARMVDQIYQQANKVYWPQPFPPGPEMESLGQTLRHEARIQGENNWTDSDEPLRAGHKKDLVMTPRLLRPKGLHKLAIYGWHNLPNGIAIQPLSLWHAERYVDYSHGIRLVHPRAEWNGESVSLAAILRDPKRASLVSFEGAFEACEVLGYACD